LFAHVARVQWEIEILSQKWYQKELVSPFQVSVLGIPIGVIATLFRTTQTINGIKAIKVSPQR